MILLGAVLLITGIITGIGALYTLGLVLLIIGILLLVLGWFGHEIGERRHYW